MKLLLFFVLIVKIVAEPLSDLCEVSCLTLNELWDRGFINGVDCLDLNNTSIEFPFCGGKPTVGDRFHFRQCILTCRNNSTNETCPNIHPTSNDFRGCEAAKAFKQGNSYNFEYEPGKFILFESLVTKTLITNAPTRSKSPQHIIEIVASILFVLLLLTIIFIYYKTKKPKQKVKEEEEEQQK